MEFGFKINKDRQVDYDKCDRNVYNYIRERDPSLNLCIACGSCTATCSANDFSHCSFRKMIVNLHRGNNKAAKEMISNCMLCGKCILVCPRGVNTRNIIMLVCQCFKHENFKI